MFFSYFLYENYETAGFYPKIYFFLGWLCDCKFCFWNKSLFESYYYDDL